MPATRVFAHSVRGRPRRRRRWRKGCRGRAPPRIASTSGSTSDRRASASPSLRSQSTCRRASPAAAARSRRRASGGASAGSSSSYQRARRIPTSQAICRGSRPVPRGGIRRSFIPLAASSAWRCHDIEPSVGSCAAYAPRAPSVHRHASLDGTRSSSSSAHAGCGCRPGSHVEPAAHHPAVRLARKELDAAADEATALREGARDLDRRVPRRVHVRRRAVLREVDDAEHDAPLRRPVIDAVQVAKERLQAGRPVERHHGDARRRCSAAAMAATAATAATALPVWRASAARGWNAACSESRRCTRPAAHGSWGGCARRSALNGGGCACAAIAAGAHRSRPAPPLSHRISSVWSRPSCE